MQINAVAEITVFPVSPCIPKATFAQCFRFPLDHNLFNMAQTLISDNQ